MFEVGKHYKVKMWQDSADGGLITEYGAARCIEVALPLIKLRSHSLVGGGEVVLNTASLAFVSAEQVDQ